MSAREGPPDVSTMHTLKVDNISSRTGIEELKKEFGRYGEVGDVYIPRHYGSGDPKGYAFVRFHDIRDAEDAMRDMEGRCIDDREVRIQMATRKRPEDPKSYYASRGRGGGDRRARSGERDYRRRSRSRSGGRYHRDRDDRYDHRDDYRRHDRGNDGRGARRPRSRSPERSRRDANGRDDSRDRGRRGRDRSPISRSYSR